jgi:hypothetical protein
VVETSLMEERSAEVYSSAEMVPSSRRREANSPDVSCLCETWQPRCGLEPSSNPIVRAGQSRSGHRKAQEAKAGTPNGKGKT